MWVMAIRTRHLAGINGVRRDFMRIRTLFFVASEAHRRLRFLAQYRVYGLVYFMTIITGHAVLLMLTAIPIGTLGALVAG